MKLLGTLSSLTTSIVLAACQTSTRIVTATTVVTASDPGACNDFVGACVVYGTNGNNAAPYTTTVYAGTPSPVTAIITATKTVYISQGATATGSDACDNFNGACVVYATNVHGTYTSAVYSGYGNAGATGNSDGLIGNAAGGGGYIGAAMGRSALVVVPALCLVGFNLGLLVFL